MNNNDFMVSIENSNLFKEYFNKITKKNIYFYWCDKEELEKISFGSRSNYSHISFFLSSKNDKIIELVNEGHIFIFLKNPKILYGVVKVESIIMKNLLKNNYLDEDDDINYADEITNNNLILIDEEKFNELVKKYKMVEVPKMSFVRFKNMYDFSYKIGIKKFNDFINGIEFKYPKYVQNKEMTKCEDKNFLNNLLNYLDNLDEQGKNNTYHTNLNQSKNEIKNNNISYQRFCIPILWNYCDVIKNKLNNLDQDYRLKKLFFSHYANCPYCEKNDNNDKSINLLDQDIIIKLINNDSDIKIFDSIVSNYRNVENLLVSTVENDLQFQKGKINIIQCLKSKSIYNNSLFIIM